MKNARFFAAAIALAASSNLFAASLTWDADVAAAGANDGAGTWDTVLTNWWDGAANVAWNNSTPDSAIFGNGGTGGVISLSEPIWAGGLTFAPVTSNYFYTIANNVLTLSAGALVDTRSNATITSALNGTNVTKIGAGALTLSGMNTLAGQMLINSGTVTFASGLAIGSMTSVVLNLSVGGGGFGTTLAFSGSFTNGAGAVLEMNANAGANKRSAINSISGVNEWAGGILLKGDGLNQPEANGGTLTLSGDITNQSFTGTLFIRGSSSGKITGNVDMGAVGLLNKTDGGTWTIGASGKTYRWGNTQVSAGTMKMGAANVLPATTVLGIGQASTESPVFDLNGFDQTVAGLSWTSQTPTNGTWGTKRIANQGTSIATLTVSNSAAYSFVGALSNGTNPLNIVKSGVGVLTLGSTNVLSGTNTFTGTTEINGGILKVAVTNALGSTNGATTVRLNGTLDMAGFALYGGDHLFISGAGFGGTGTVINTGAAQQQGIRGVTLQGDAMVAAWNNRWDFRPPSGLGAIDTAGYTLSVIAPGTIGIVDCAVTNIGAINVASGSLYLTRGTISGPGVISAGAGRAVVFENCSSGTIDASILLTNATLRLIGSNSFACGSAVGVEGLVLMDVATNMTLTLTNGLIGSGGISTINGGTLVLSGQSSHSGVTRVDVGVLQNAGGADRLPTTGTVAVNGDGSPIATWNLNGQSQTIAALNGTNIVGSRVTLGGGSLAFAGSGSATGEFFGAISGAGAVVMSSGAQILSSSNSYEGGTTVNGGSLIVRHDTALGTGVVTIAGGSLTLDTAGLWGGNVTGFNNRADSNPKWTVDRKTTFANTTDLLAFPSNSTWIYTGYLNVTGSSSVTWTFAERFDDSTYLRINGVAVLDDTSWSNAVKGTVTLAPGLHAFEVRLGQSSGGVGPGGGWTLGFGFDPLGRDSLTPTNFIEMVDAGDGSLFVRDDLSVRNDMTLNSDLSVSVPASKAALSGTISGVGGIAKSGAGTLVIAGVAANSGPISANAGPLMINGPCTGTGTVTIATNALLWGTGTVTTAATVINAGAKIGPSSAQVLGTLTLADLTLDPDARVTALLNGTNPTVIATGTLTVDADAIAVLPVSTVTTGTYALIKYGSLSGGVGDFELGALPNGSSGYLTNNTANKTIDLVITNSGAGVKWSGSVDASWDVGLTANWKSILSGGSTVFTPFDALLFDDSASGNFTVAVVQAVSPGSITVSNDTKDYVVGGLSIGGGGGLTKDGAAKLTINNANSFTGATVVKAGTLAIAADSSLGAVPAALTPGQLSLQNGTTLEIAGLTTLSANRGIAIGPSSGQGSSTISVANGVTATIASSIANASGGTGALVKAGAGTLTLSATIGYAGTTTINEGTLQLAGGANRLGTNGIVIVSNGAAFNLGGQNQALTRLLGQGVVTGTASTLSLSIGNGATNRVEATLAGTFGLNKTGTVSNELGLLYLAGVNTFTGNVTITAGPVIINNSSALGVGPKTVDLVNGTAGRPTLSLDGSAGNIVLASNITIRTSNNAGTMTNLVGDNVINGNFTLTGGGGDTVIKVAGGTLTINGNMTFDQQGRSLVIGGANNGLINGSVRAVTNIFNVGLQKQDGGTWILASDNSYDAVTAISGGTLQIGNGSSSGSLGTNTCTINAGCSLVFNRAGVLTNVALLTGAGSVTKTGSGTVILPKVETYTGPTAVNGGTLVVSGSLGTSAVSVGVSAALIVPGTVSGPVTINTNGLLSVGGTVNARVSGTTGVTVLVNGTVNSSYTNFSGGFIGGTGTISGSVASSAIVAPGTTDTVGKLTIGQNFTQDSSGMLTMRIGGNGVNDQFLVGGQASFGGALNIVLTNGYTGGLGDTFFLVEAAGGITGGFAVTNLPALAPGLAWTNVDVGNNYIVLSITNGPASGYDVWAGVITNGMTNATDSATGDGYPNLLKYATGSSPTNSDNLAQMNSGRTNGMFALRFNHNTNASDITLIIEGSHAATDNAAWNGIATNIHGSWGATSNYSENTGTTPASVVVWDTDTTATNRYLRLRVTRP